MLKASAVSAKGPIQIQVDATDTVHKVLSIIEIIPLQGEESITLSYPRLEIGSHAPTVSVADLAGLELQLNGRPLAGYLLTRLNSHHGAYLQNDLKNTGYSLIFDATENK